VKWPSRDLDNDDKPVGGGPRVAPGTYTAVLSLGDHRDTVSMTLAADPRVPFDGERHAEGVALMTEVQEEVDRLASLMQDLALARETVQAMEPVWATQPDSLRTGVDSLSTQFTEGVSDIHDMLWTPEDFVGYDHVTVRVMGQVYDAMPDIREGATPNAKRKLEVARKAVDEVEEAVEALMTDVWTLLLEEADKLSVSMQGVHDGLRRSE